MGETKSRVKAITEYPCTACQETIREGDEAIWIPSDPMPKATPQAGLFHPDCYFDEVAPDAEHHQDTTIRDALKQALPGLTKTTRSTRVNDQGPLVETVVVQLPGLEELRFWLEESQVFIQHETQGSPTTIEANDLLDWLDENLVPLVYETTKRLREEADELERILGF